MNTKYHHKNSFKSALPSEYDVIELDAIFGLQGFGKLNFDLVLNVVFKSH